MLRLEGYPEKMLKIDDLVFILPDDFEGDFIEGLECLIKHLKCEKSSKEIDDGKSSVESLFNQSECDCTLKLCMRYGIFRKGTDGYELIS